MDEIVCNSTFYEDFWSETSYKQEFAFNAAVHDRFPGIQKVWGELKKPVDVLDFGCGNGVLTYWLWSNEFGKNVCGVDVSSTAINDANSCFKRDGLFYETTKKYEEDKSKKFDVVVSSHVLEHIRGPKVLLDSLALKADWFVFEVPLERCLVPNIVDFFSKTARDDNKLGHVNFWNKSQFRSLMNNSNLRVIRDHHYASAPFSPYQKRYKKFIQQMLLKVFGLSIYSLIFATHYVVLARKK